jgi:hypothetical protein
MDETLAETPATHLYAPQQAVPAVEKEHEEDLLSQAAHLGTEVTVNVRG